MQGTLYSLQNLDDKISKLNLNSKDENELLEIVKEMKECTEHEKAILNKVLTLQKLENQQIELEKKAMNVVDCFESVMMMYQSAASKKGLSLSFENHLIEKSSHYALGDPDQLKEVITNFISNAIKYTEQGSVLVKLNKEIIHENVIIYSASVTDTGFGMTNEEKKRLFKRFSRLKGSSSGSYEGFF